MKRLYLAIRRWLPRRRRRFWRYVSPQRRGVALLILSLLLAVVYAYWYATNDRRVRRLATEYLREFTGGVVRIEEADFNLFGAVELKGVSVFVPGSRSPEPFFRARTVLLRHRPWALFVHGHLVPTEIVCMAPMVTLEHDVPTDTYNASRLFAAAHRPEGAELAGGLPPVRVRQGRLRVIETDRQLRQLVGETAVEMSMLPQDSKTYEVAFEQREAGGEQAMRGRLELDVVEGKVELVSGVLPLPTLDKAVPRKYGQWRQRYNITGEVSLRGGRRAGDAEQLVTAELSDVRLRLPEEEGGLEITHVNGNVVFDLARDEVRLEDISGRLPQAGGASIKISGTYQGYDPDSPFRVRLQVSDMTLPAAEDVTGALGATVADVHRTYSPRGPMDLTVAISRYGGDASEEGERPDDGEAAAEPEPEDGEQGEVPEFRVTGTASPKGMSLKLKSLPYRLDGLRGKLTFAADRLHEKPTFINNRVKLQSLRARHGEAAIELTGEIRGGLSQGAYDIRGEARDAALGQDLRDALPKRFGRLWRELSPRGRASIQFHVHREEPGGSEDVDATILLDGECAMTYRGFPYPLEKLYGEVHVTDDGVVIDSVRGRGQGRMSCTMDGRLARLYSDSPEVALNIEVASLPLDETLTAALDEKARSVMESLHATGTAESVSARVRQSGGGSLEYTVLTRVRDAEFCADAFPYPVRDARGVLTIQRGRVVIESLTGRNGESEVDVSGQVLLDRSPAVIDLNVRADALALDDRLRDALPASVRDIWQSLSPSGVADVRLALRTGAPDAPNGIDYRLEVTPREMQVSYAQFPYPFRAVEGTVTASPGRIELHDVLGRENEASTYLDGEITTAGGVRTADLTVRVRKVAIDEALLASVPDGLEPLAGRFRPGGTCDVDLQTLRFRAPAEPTNAPSSAPATQPASAPAEPPLWNAEGWVAFDGAVIDLGFGHKTVSGKVTGSGGRTEEGLELDAEVALDRVLVGEREITEVTGHLIKPAGNTRMRVNELLGRAYGGRLYGLAEIELSDPLKYALSLSVEGVQLGGLLRAGRKRTETEGEDGDEAESDIEGTLTGKLEYRATSGKPDSQQAAGRLRISDARLYRLPVPLELLHVVTLSLPGEAAFTEGDVQYEMHGQELTFREIHLRGSALSVVGSGQMDMKTERLRLNFLAGPPGKVPRIAAGLEEVLKPLAREIVEIRITGTLSNPGEPRTVAFRSLQDAVNRLLNPDREEGP